MTQVLVLNPPDSPLAELLREADLPGGELSFAAPGAASREALESAVVVLGAPEAAAAVVPDCPRLQWVQSTWAGIGPLLQTPRRDYQLTALKGVFGQLMSEYVLGWVLALERQIIQRAMEREWNPALGRSVAGRRMGIMGTGSIGVHVAETARALGIVVVGLNSDGRATEPFEQCFPSSERLQFAQGLDYLVSVLPETPQTDNLVDAALLSKLNAEAVFINGGRGNCVVESDLLSALEQGILRAAALDVMRVEPLPASSELWRVPNLFITSHTAAPTSQAAAVDVFCDNFRRFVAGKPLLHLVDFARGY